MLEIGFVCGIEVTRTWNRIVAVVLGGMLSICIPLRGLSFGRALPVHDNTILYKARICWDDICNNNVFDLYISVIYDGNCIRDDSL